MYHIIFPAQCVAGISSMEVKQILEALAEASFIIPATFVFKFLVRIFRIQEIRTRNNSVFGHFSRSGMFLFKILNSKGKTDYVKKNLDNSFL